MTEINMSLLDEWQMRLLYISIYSGLGLIGNKEYVHLNDMMIAAYPMLRQEYNRIKKLPKTTDVRATVRFSKRFPPLEAVISAFQKVIRGKDREAALEKWRFTCRHNSDRVVFGYILQYGDSLKAARRVAEGLVLQMDRVNTPLELARGELYYIQTEPDPGYINQFKKNTYMIVGHDKAGCPLIVSRPQFHDPKAQSKDAAVRLVVNVLEHVFMALHDDAPGCTMLWDLQGWSLTNRDHHMIWFMIQCVHTIYPRLFARIIMHRAPRVFRIGWDLVERWVDPVVCKEMIFTRTTEDLLEYIPANQLPKFLGGSSKYDTTQWTDPDPADQVLLNDVKGGTELLNERLRLLEEFEKKNIDWFSGNKDVTERVQLAEQIADNYWKLDPYVRSRFIWDRHGTLGLLRSQFAEGGVSQPTCRINRPIIKHNITMGELARMTSSANAKKNKRVSSLSTINANGSLSKLSATISGEASPHASRTPLIQ